MFFRITKKITGVILDSKTKTTHCLQEIIKQTLMGCFFVEGVRGKSLAEEVLLKLKAYKI